MDFILIIWRCFRNCGLSVDNDLLCGHRCQFLHIPSESNAIDIGLCGLANTLYGVLQEFIEFAVSP